MTKLEELEAISGHLGEVEAQYLSEIGQFGDAWAGSEAEVAELRACVADLEAECEALGLLKPWVPAPAPQKALDPDDIPF